MKIHFSFVKFKVYWSFIRIFAKKYEILPILVVYYNRRPYKQ